MQIQEVLYTQGFGTRRVCAGLVQQGWVQVFASAEDSAAQPCADPAAEFEPEGLRFRVQGRDWPFAQRAYIVLNKPAGTECSQKPSTYPSIYSLLPAPLRTRPQKSAVQGVQAVGRLDQDTTGMLLLTDDGQFIHRMSSPKHHVPKVYELTTEDALDEKVVSKLLQGVVLNDDPAPVKAAACSLTGSHTLQLTLTEGKYHQVKRMLAATGPKVVQLHRSRIGDMALTEDLAPGQWRWLSETELSALTRKQAQA